MTRYVIARSLKDAKEVSDLVERRSLKRAFELWDAALASDKRLKLYRVKITAEKIRPTK